MKFSYFGNSNKKLGLAALGRGITAFLSDLAPSFSAHLGSNVLMRPYSKRHYHEGVIKADGELRLQTSMGIAHVNLYGHGSNVVIVSHGWADNSQTFQHLVANLVDQGYFVAAIDHIGHGKSSGTKSNLPNFIESLELLIEHFEHERVTIKSIIGHSMGAIATFNLPFETLKPRKIILISSPIKLFELMFKKVEQAGISKKLLTKTLEKVCHPYGVTWQELTSESNRGKLKLPITFIHDRFDKYAPFSDVEKFLDQEKNDLVVTEGLGHRNILRDTKVIDRIAQVIEA